jgi:hypothetical protein
MNQAEILQVYNELKNHLNSLYEEEPLLWGKAFFDHHFRLLTPYFHEKILSLCMTEMRLAVASPRGSAKTTIILFLYLIYSLCFKKRHFPLIVSNTFKKAAEALETIKSEFRHNEKLRENFPIEIIRDSYGDSIFQHSDGFRQRVLCKGAEQIGSVRGEKFGAYRPDLILVDDLEDDEMVKNPDRRRDLKDVYEEALMEAGEPGVTQVIVDGTILHDDSLLADLVAKDLYPQYRKIKYKARYEYEGITYSLWPERWTVHDLNEEEKLNPSRFAKEKQNDPVSGMMSSIKRDDFRYWTIENNRAILFNKSSMVAHNYDLMDCFAAISCDLAWEEKRSSDFSVIMPGFLTPGSDLLIETYICKKGLRPSEIEEILFTMETRLRALTGTTVPIGFEKAKLEKVIRHLLRQAMKKRNHWLSFKDLEWITDKNERILSKLEPRYNQHSIYHRRGMGDYEHQLLRVPHGTHDDLPDAAQGLTQLLKYSKTVKKIPPKDSEWEWIMKKVKDKKKGRHNPYVFGQKGRGFSIPAEESFR